MASSRTVPDLRVQSPSPQQARQWFQLDPSLLLERLVPGSGEGTHALSCFETADGFRLDVGGMMRTGGIVDIARAERQHDPKAPDCDLLSGWWSPLHRALIFHLQMLARDDFFPEDQ